MILIVGKDFGQSRQEIKEQAETALNKMTPEEIDKKIKEAGLTREEATQKAKLLNLNLEDYLARLQTTSRTPYEAIDSTQIRTAAKKVVKDTTKISPFFSVRIIQIPGFIGRRGTESLVPFGYDLFTLPAPTFEPNMNAATPQNYALGSGDDVMISVWGETQLYYTLTVNKEGNVIVPNVGPVPANGVTIQQFRDRLVRKMTAVYSGLKNGETGATTFLDVSLGKVKLIQVFVLGEVVRPGAYSLSSMATVLQAIYFAGGPTVNGTLREVLVNRDTKTFATIDLYSYLIKGDKSKDIRLQDGDVVFINPVNKRAAIIGDVIRPAVYEIKDKDNLGNLLVLSGGLRFDAYFNRVHIERVIPFDQRKNYANNLLDIDLKFNSIAELQKNTFQLEDGDIVSIERITDLAENKVTITGNVQKPGPYQLKSGMRISDLIMAADSFQRNTFAERGTLYRLLPNLRRELKPFIPREALSKNPAHNFLLQNEDSVEIYRESLFFPESTVTISGSVRHPGDYKRFDKMTLADLIVMAGGLLDNASHEGIEVSSVDTSDVKIYTITTKVNLSPDYWNVSNGQSYQLKDHDYVFVPRDPRIDYQRILKIYGMVMYPGSYPLLYAGERLSSIIKRAGGLKEGAYLEGSEYFRAGKGTGKIPLDMKRAYEDPSSPDNLVVNEGDSIYIWWKDDIVFVRGEVYVPNPVIYKPGASLKYYIAQAGGFTDQANSGAAVAILPTGKKWEPGWFFLPDPEIMPGSTVYVPKKIEVEDKTLPTLAQLATILASLAAITVALVQVKK